MALSSDLMPILIVRQIKMGILLSLKIAKPIIVMLAVLNVTVIAFASSDMIGIDNGKLFIKARNASLGAIVAELNSEFGIEVNGLAALENDKITFTFESVSQEELVKGLLRHLNIKNYALEFVEDKLQRVIVVSGTKRIGLGLDGTNTKSSQIEETVTVAVIKNIIESSQAVTLGLLQGDIILQYDGIRIVNAAQLVKEVKKRSDKNQIEMIVVRDKLPARLFLQGGVIGVRIATERIAKQEYLNYF